MDVRFAALNPADRYLAEGQYPAKPALPHVLGRDGVGTVREIGAGVTSVKPGETVVVLRGETGVRAGLPEPSTRVCHHRSMRHSRRSDHLFD